MCYDGEVGQKTATNLYKSSCQLVKSDGANHKPQNQPSPHLVNSKSYKKLLPIDIKQR
jgi:hypothetical protein